MFYKEIDSIRATEDKAQSLIDKANADAKAFIEKSRQEASDILLRAEKDSEKLMQENIAEGQEVAGHNYDNSLADAAREAEAIEEAAARNAAKAVDLISERIVKQIGNS